MRFWCDGSRFISIFTFCPFLGFFLFSLFRSSKLNWSGPVWVAILPFIAWQMVSVSGAPNKRIENFIQRAWPPTLFVTVLFWGAFLHFLVMGIPGFGYPRETDLTSFIGWSNLAAEIEKIEDEIEKETEIEPLVIGMDKNKIASELAFYRNKGERVLGDEVEHEGFQYTTGRHLLGMESLMFKYWSPQRPRSPEGKQREILILVSRELSEFKKEQIHASGWAISEIKNLIVEKAGVPVGEIYSYPCHSSPITVLLYCDKETFWRRRSIFGAVWIFAAFIFSTTAFFAVPFFSEDIWEEIGTTSSGERIFVNLNEIKFSVAWASRAWVKVELSEKEKQRLIKKYGKKFNNVAYSVMLIAVLCKEKKSAVLSTTTFSNEGAIIESFDVKEEVWNYIVPGSAGQILSKILCDPEMKKQVQQRLRREKGEAESNHGHDVEKPWKKHF